MFLYPEGSETLMNLHNFYILFIQYIVTRFVPQAISVKTYEVRRLNESSYIVTSFPEYDFDDTKGTDSTCNGKIVFMNDNKEFMKPDHNPTHQTTTVSIDESVIKKTHVISADAIKKARENYFKTFYATMKTPSKTTLNAPMFFSSLNYPDINPKGKGGTQLNHNLEMARNLALTLIFGLQKHDHDVVKFKDSVVKRKTSK